MKLISQTQKPPPSADFEHEDEKLLQVMRVAVFCIIELFWRIEGRLSRMGLGLHFSVEAIATDLLLSFLLLL